MDTDFWRMEVGKVLGAACYLCYLHFTCFFQPVRWGSHRVPHSLCLFEFDRRRRSCMAWKHLELAVKLIRKWCFSFDSVFDLMMNRCVFNQIFWYGKDLPFYHILPHSLQKDLPVYPFWGSKPHWASALMVWIRLQASLQNLRHSGFHVMCRNGCCKYMNQILMLLWKYDIEKED